MSDLYVLPPRFRRWFKLLSDPMSKSNTKSIELNKVQVDYVYNLLTIHENDPDAPAIKKILDIPRKEWDDEFELEQSHGD